MQTTQTFQGVEATTDMTPKTGDNLRRKHRQPKEIGRKRAKVCDSDNSHSRFLFLYFATATFP